MTGRRAVRRVRGRRTNKLFLIWYIRKRFVVSIRSTIVYDQKLWAIRENVYIPRWNNTHLTVEPKSRRTREGLYRRLNPVMLNRPPPVVAAAARRCLFQDDRRSLAACNDDNAALEMAMTIERELLARKRDQWNFDFLNGTPVMEEDLCNNNWQWDIIVTS